MRLIDADTLMKQIDADSNGNEGQYGDEWQFIKTIENAPAIEAIYICDRKKCADCNPMCDFTRDINHAGTTDKVLLIDKIDLKGATR